MAGGQFVHSGGRVVTMAGRRVGDNPNCCWQQSRLCTTGNPSGKWLPVTKIPVGKVIVEGGACYIFQDGDPTTICTPASQHTQPVVSATSCADDACKTPCLLYCCQAACPSGYIACVDSIDVTLSGVTFPTTAVDTGSFTALMVGDPNGVTIRCFPGGSFGFISPTISGYSYTLTEDTGGAVWYTLSGIQVNLAVNFDTYDPISFNPDPFDTIDTPNGQCGTFTNQIVGKVYYQMGAISAVYGGPFPPGGCGMPPGNLFAFDDFPYTTDEYNAILASKNCATSYTLPNYICAGDGSDGAQPCNNGGIGCGGAATIKVNWTCRQIAP